MAALFIWLAGAASYLLLVGSFGLDELVAAVLLGALGLGWHVAVLHDGAPRFRFERPALRAAASALIGLPGAVGRVGARLAAAILRPVEGRRVEQPFHRGRVGEARERGRRAVVVLATSLAPDSYALRLPVDEEAIVFHSLTGATPSRDPRWPS